MTKTLNLVLSLLIGCNLSAQNFNVSKTEAIKAADMIEASIKNNDVSVLGNFFYLPLLSDKIKEQSIQAKKSPAMFEGFKSSFNMKPIATQIISSFQDGNYQLLREYESAGKTHLLFRAFGKSGINYHDYTLVKINNEVKATDVFVYLSGEEISATIADLVDASTPANYEGAEMSETLRVLLKLKEFKKNNNNEAVVSEYESANESIKKNKAVLIVYMNACQNIGEMDKYKAALEYYSATFPDASNTPLLMIDFYFLNKDYEKSLIAINKLDTLVKTDPFLDFFRASIFMAQGDNEKAKTYADNVFKKFPAIAAILQIVVMLHMDNNEVTSAKEAIKVYLKIEGFKQQVVDDLYLQYPELKD